MLLVIVSVLGLLQLDRFGDFCGASGEIAGIFNELADVNPRALRIPLLIFFLALDELAMYPSATVLDLHPPARFISVIVAPASAKSVAPIIIMEIIKSVMLSNARRRRN